MTALLLSSCSEETVAPDPTSAIGTFIRSIETFPDPPESNTGEHMFQDAHVDSVYDPGEGHFVCQVSDYRMDKNLHETTVFSPNDVSLWPGSLVRGGDLDNGVLNPIVADRAALIVGTDLTGLPEAENSRQVADPNHLRVFGAINEICDAYMTGHSSGQIGARLAFDETYIEDFSQSMLDLGISMSWWSWGSGSLQSDFSASHEEFTTSYLCRFSQAYFTASVVPPASPEDVFGDGVGVGDLSGYMSDGDPPCYVSSVTYGRVGFLAVHSYARRDSVSLAVKAAFSTMGFETEGEMNASYERILNQSEIKIMVRGGDATDGVLPIIGDPIQGMRDWIEGGAALTEPSSAIPVSYTTRYLKDNRLAAFAYANEWTVEECEPATKLFQVAVPRLHCVTADDGIADGTIEVYYTFELEYEPFEGADAVIETILSRPSGNAVDMSDGSNHDMPDAWRDVWMPETRGSRFRLNVFVADHDASSSNDVIGDFSTDWYAWDDWRSSSFCTFPSTYPEPGGDPATCSRHMREDSGTDVIVYWEIRTPEVP